MCCQAYCDVIHYWPRIFCSWGNNNDQTCFPLLDAVISELLTTASEHVDKHIWPERKVIRHATFVVYVSNKYRVLGYWPLSKPGLFLWKSALKHGKEYFVSGCLKQGKVPGNVVFHTFDSEKAFSFRGLCPLTTAKGIAWFVPLKESLRAQ